MEPPKRLSERVESWLSRVPGIRTYRDREHRRETDKHLREHLASRLQEARSSLSRMALDVSQRGQLDSLDKLDRLSSRIQQMADAIRYASYRYAGVFDLDKVREEELDQLYDCDLSLIDDLEKIQAKVQELDRDTPQEALKNRIGEADRLLDLLRQKFDRRSEFLGRLGSGVGSRDERKRSV